MTLRVFMLDDHEIVRRGVRDLLEEDRRRLRTTSDFVSPRHDEVPRDRSPRSRGWLGFREHTRDFLERECARRASLCTTLGRDRGEADRYCVCRESTRSDDRTDRDRVIAVGRVRAERGDDAEEHAGDRGTRDEAHHTEETIVLAGGFDHF
jgi:hypothetical protein